MTLAWPMWLEHRDLRLVAASAWRRLPSADVDAPARLAFLEGVDTAAQLTVDGWERGADVAGAGSDDEALLARLGAANVPVLGSVARANAEGVALIVAPVGAVRRSSEPIRLGVDANAAAQLSDWLGEKLDVAGAVRRLTTELLMPLPGVANRCAALMSHVPVEDPLNGGLQLHGADRCLHVRLDADRRMLVANVRGPARRDARLEETLQVIEAPIAFTVLEEATHLDAAARRASTDRTQRYLGIWCSYQREHVRRELQVVRSFGSVAFSSARRRGDIRWELELRRREHVERLTNTAGATFEVYAVAPHHLTPGVEEDPLEVIASLAKPIANVRVVSGQRDGRVDIDVVQAPGKSLPPQLPAPGLLTLGLGGERVQLERRQSAAARVEEHPDLLQALADREVPRPSRPRRRPLRRLPASVQRIFGDHEPTRAQRNALELAWEVGGLLAIQGPPGTGKTTVVAAIRELYAHENGNGERQDASTLLSAFQNAAVDEVVKRAGVYGLPAKRVRSKKEVARLEGADELARWVEQRLRHLDERLASIEGGEAAAIARKAGLLARDYLAAAQSSADTSRLLRRLSEMSSSDGTRLLSHELRLRLERRADELEREADSVERRQARYARRLRRASVLLRCTPASWADDGPDAALDALLTLEAHDILTAEEADALASASANALADGPPAQLPAIRDRLLDEASRSRALTLGVTRDAEATELAHAVLSELRDRPGGAEAARLRALSRFREHLAGDRDELERTLDRYDRAIGATTSMSGSMHVTGRQYRLVVVDEAARANPLDLIIPLVLGDETKIVVGDHRQLPQLLEHDLVERVVAGEGDIEALMRQSLFERIFQVLHRSGRAITLSEQFRMHPDLGTFVSQTFYPEGERFASPVPARKFAHNLAGYEDVAAAWLDVPGGQSRGEIREGTSVRRPFEAGAVAQELKRLMERDPGLSFGVIATYRAQVGELWKALEELKLAQPGQRVLHPKLRICRDTRGKPILDAEGTQVERLRVGTVDAFQGMEFDVVFVSLVRSNRRTEPRARFGHTLDRPRLNVAMSRAKRLLIVAADSRTLLVDDEAAEPLRAYRRLCEERGKVVRCAL